MEEESLLTDEIRESFAAELKALDADTASGTLEAVKDINPADAAEARKIAKERDIDFQYALKFREDFKAASQREKREKTIAESPLIQSLAKEPDRAAVIWDSIDQLRELEETAQKTRSERPVNNKLDFRNLVSIDFDGIFGQRKVPTVHDRALGESVFGPGGREPRIVEREKTGLEEFVVKTPQAYIDGLASSSQNVFYTQMLRLQESAYKRHLANATAAEQSGDAERATDLLVKSDQAFARAVDNVDELRRVDRELKESSARSDNFVVQSALSGVQSLGQMTPALAVGFATRNPNAALAIMGATVEGNAYAEARLEGLGHQKASDYAAVMTVIELGTEYLPAQQVIGGVLKGSFKKNLAKYLLTEQATEQVATHAGDFAKWQFFHNSEPKTLIDTGKRKTFADYVRERPTAAAATVIATFVASAPLSAIAAGGEVQSEREKIEQAREYESRLDQIRTKIEAVPAAQLDREIVKQAAQLATEGNEVFIDAEALNTLYQSDSEGIARLAEELDIPFDTIEEHVSNGTDLPVPEASVLMAQDSYEFLSQNTKEALDGQTPLQAQENESELETSEEEIQARYEEEQQALEGFEAVGQDVEQKLLDAGRSPSEASAVARVWTRIFQNLQERGEDVSGIYEQLGLQVVGPGQNVESNPDNTLNQFGGQLAENAPLDSLEDAKRAEAGGVSQDEIWQLFGWNKGKDGQWRFEIDDSASELNVERIGTDYIEEGSSFFSGRVGDILKHDELFAQYPWIADVRVEVGLGEFYGNEGGIEDFSIRVHGENPLMAHSILLHEIQHVIQNYESFAQGGGLATIQKQNERFIEALETERESAGDNRQRVIDHEIGRLKLANMALNPSLSEYMGGGIDFEGYRAGEGEIEARNTQARQDLTAEERRATPPSQTRDVSPDRSFVVGGAVMIEFDPVAFDQVSEIIEDVHAEFDARPDVVEPDVKESPEQFISGLLARGLDLTVENANRNAEHREPNTPFGSTRHRDREIANRVKEAGLTEADFTPRFARYGLGDLLGDAVPPSVLDEVDIPAPGSLFQGEGKANVEIPGGFGLGNILEDGDVIVRLTEAADRTSFLHESMHIFFEMFDALAKQGSPYAQELMNDARAYLNLEPDAPIDRDSHEKIADQWELYAARGETKAKELKSVFREFKRWFADLYAQIKYMLRKLDPEAIDLFDRMLVSEQDMQTAEEQALAAQAPKELADIMTPEQVEARAKARQKAADTANDRIFGKYVESYQRKLKDSYKKEKKEVANEIRATLMEEPAYQAREKLGDSLKLSKKEIKGKSPEDIRRLRKQKAREEVGDFELDGIATEFGYTSGDQMLNAVLDVPSLESEVNRLTEAAMTAHDRDILTDGTATEEAVKASLNDNNLKVLQIDREAIAQRLSARPIPVEQIKADAKFTIENKPIADVIKPGEYALRAKQYHSKALKLAAKGKWEQAYSAANYALYQHELSRLAFKARDEIGVAHRYLNKFRPSRFPKKGVTEKKIHPDYIKAIQKIVSLPDATNQQRTFAELELFANEQAANGHNPALPPQVIEKSPVPALNQMTLSGIRAFKRGLRSVEVVGRRLSEESSAEFEGLVDQVVENVDTAFGDRARNEFTRNATLKQQLANPKKMADALILRWPFIIKMLQGGKRGLLIDKFDIELSNAETRRNQRRNDLTKKITQILKRHNVYKDLPRRLDAPLIDGALPVRMSQVLAVALNMGTESNRARLALDPQIARQTGGNIDSLFEFIDKTLERRHWEAVQEIWDTIDSLRPEAFALEEELTGVRPERVESSRVKTRHGTYKGGYFPIKFDMRAPENEDIRRQQNEDEWKAMATGTTTKASTKQGALQSRVTNPGQRTLRLDMSIIFEHIDEMTNDIYMRKISSELMRILKHKKFVNIMKETHGDKMLESMEEILRRTVAGAPRSIGSEKWLQSILRGFRMNLTIAALGFNLTTASLAGLSYTQSVLPEYGPKIVKKGLAAFLRNPLTALNLMRDKSALMKERRSTYRLEAHETFAREFPDTRAKQARAMYSVFQGISFSVISEFEIWTVSGPLWMGVYEDAKLRGRSEEMAVGEADRAVRVTQGSGSMMDQSVLQGASEYIRPLTLMYGYMSGVYGIARTNLFNARNLQKFTAIATTIFLSVGVTTLLEEMLREGLGGDDEDAFLNRYLLRSLNNFFGMVPLASEIYSPYDQGSPTITAVQGLYDTTVDLVESFEEGEIEGKVMVRALKNVGTATGFPGTYQIARAMKTHIEEGSDGSWHDYLFSGPDEDKGR